MIAKISGTLAEVANGLALIEVGEIGYEVMVPGYAQQLLAGKQGQQVSLYTLEYLEGSLAAGSNLVPRLIGFPHSEERSFFQRFTSVKGVGMRKALKALSIPVSRVAGAIEAKDARLLQTLPGVGKRLADQMIATLSGKLDEFALVAAAQRGETGLNPFLQPGELLRLSGDPHPDDLGPPGIGEDPQTLRPEEDGG